MTSEEKIALQNLTVAVNRVASLLERVLAEIEKREKAEAES